MVAEYTTKVEYQDLYDAVGKTAAEKYGMDAYVDGVDNVGTGDGEGLSGQDHQKERQDGWFHRQRRSDPGVRGC